MYICMQHACMYVRTCVCLSLWLKGPVTDPILGAGHVSIPLLLLPGLEGELSLDSLSLSVSLGMRMLASAAENGRGKETRGGRERRARAL